MGIKIEELVSRYPVLYHMASSGSWPSIQKHGLLSSASLVELFEVPEPKRTDLLTKQRKTSMPLEHSVHGTAVLRDQKPLSAKNLARCLVGCDAEAWYRILNERVFFWLDRDRLLTLMSAGEYVGKPHTVLEVDTVKLVSKHSENIELAHMNTGNTRPYPHRRGRDTFLKLDAYPYDLRKRLPNYSAVVELTVLHGVKEVAEYVRRVEHAEVAGGRYRVVESLSP